MYNTIRDAKRGECLKLDIIKVMNEDLSEVSLNTTLDISGVEVEEGKNSFPNGAQVSLELKNIHGCVTLRLVCETDFHTECARCLRDVVEKVAFDFESTIRVDDNAPEYIDSHAVIIDSSNQLDLTELVSGLVLMNLPMKSLCKDDCRGICAKCGEDLNEGECGCSPDIDPRLAKLKELLD
jgi:uncharacterized protein